jgi:hypothetical protein
MIKYSATMVSQKSMKHANDIPERFRFDKTKDSGRL